MAQRIVELRDKSTGFHDFETGFDIVRDQRKPLGAKVGRATTQALRNGRLVEVHAEAKDNKPGDGK